jgi:hypothetical protein
MRETRQYPFAGGLNVVDPQVKLPPGVLTFAKNYECVASAAGGYRRVDGYERVDGRAARASLATYVRIPFVSGGPRVIQIGETVVGETSGATGIVVGTIDLTTGTWDDGTASGELRVTAVVGTFTADENLLVTGINSATLVGAALPRTIGDSSYKTWLRQAQAYYRALIGPVPGEGPVRGVALYQGALLAVRNAVGGATAVMWQATPAGWVSKKVGLTPSGRYRFVVYNFQGTSGTEKLFGVSGVHKAFQWDGTTWTDITTGMPNEDTTMAPRTIAVHKSCLWLGFPLGQLENSSIADPLTWAIRTGAGIIGTGDEITDMIPSRSDTLVVYGNNSVHILYGTPGVDLQLRRYGGTLGGLAFTAQEIAGQPLSLDNRGAFFLTAAQTFGDFNTSTLTKTIRPLIDVRTNAVRETYISREKNQYRVIFNDKSSLIATFVGGKLVGWGIADYAHQFNCAVSGEDVNGQEVMYAGTDDGYVMQLDSGTSFDGASIESIGRVPFSSMGSPAHKKRYYLIELELDAPLPFELQVATEFNYGAEGLGLGYTSSMPQSGGLWDSAVWELFYWDAAVVSTATLNISGIGRNMGLIFRHEDDIDASFTLQAATIQFSIWGQQR